MQVNSLREGMPEILFSDPRRIGLALIELGQALLGTVSAPEGKTGPIGGTTCHNSNGYTLSELQADFIRTKAKTGRSDRYIRALRVSLAIRYFAGLRSSECNKLGKAEIKEGFIEVTAAKAKTPRRCLAGCRAERAGIVEQLADLVVYGCCPVRIVKLDVGVGLDGVQEVRAPNGAGIILTSVCLWHN
jgi:hypothetical protein